MKKIVLLLVLSISIYNAKAQKAEDSVKAVINKLFVSMKSADAKSMQECFADSAILQTVDRNGKVKTESIKDFVEQISKLPKDAADERITFDVIRVDDVLAIAWTPYQFYFKSKFSHCGADSFQLVRVNGAWKIQYIIDTRRRNCGASSNPSGGGAF